MIQQVNAIFEHGVLRPLAPLDLQEQAVVSLSIEQLSSDGRDREETEPTLFELLDEVGLVGCIEDAPVDLSTNPRYMEGFGKSGS